MAEKDDVMEEGPAFLPLLDTLDGSEGDVPSGGGPGPSSSSGGITGSASGTKVVVKNIPPAPPWNPLSSPDWDKESHTKEALLRIKRYVACK